MSAMSNLDAELQQLAACGQLFVWYVYNDPDDRLWVTKADALRHAHAIWPDESPEFCDSIVACAQVQTYW